MRANQKLCITCGKVHQSMGDECQTCHRLTASRKNTWQQRNYVSLGHLTIPQTPTRVHPLSDEETLAHLHAFVSEFTDLTPPSPVRYYTPSEIDNYLSERSLI